GVGLSLYIPPGRIKWGVFLRELFGPVLCPDRDYTLYIGPDLMDDRGQRLGKAFTKKFRTIAEDRVRVELSSWQVKVPAAGTRQPLELAFRKVIDRKSLERFLTVVDAPGSPVAGRFTVGREERSWSFQPEKAWQEAAYRICVDEKLEDVAGNNPLRPFDVDLKAAAPQPQSLSLSFRPTPALRPGH